MVATALQVAKRALLATMRTAAVLFGLSMTCNWDSADSEVVSFFRKLALRAHADRPGGSRVQQQRLNDARASWEQAFFLAACLLEGDMMSAIPLSSFCRTDAFLNHFVLPFLLLELIVCNSNSYN